MAHTLGYKLMLTTRVYAVNPLLRDVTNNAIRTYHQRTLHVLELCEVCVCVCGLIVIQVVVIVSVYMDTIHR